MCHAPVTCRQPFENNDKLIGQVAKLTILNSWRLYNIDFATLYELKNNKPQ